MRRNEKYFAAQAKALQKYYSQGARGRGACNQDEAWTEGEIEAITAPDRPRDAVLSVALDRSIRAIQIKRSRVKRAP